MDLSIAVNPSDMEVLVLEAAVDQRSQRDARAWEEAVDWGVTDFGALCPSDRRIATAPDFD